MANAAMKASGIRLPFALLSRHSRAKIAQWRGPGRTTYEVEESGVAVEIDAGLEAQRLEGPQAKEARSRRAGAPPRQRPAERILDQAREADPSRRGLHLTDEVGRFILTRGARSMSALFDLLEQLDQASLQAQRKLTIPFLKETLGW